MMIMNSRPWEDWIWRIQVHKCTHCSNFMCSSSVSCDFPSNIYCWICMWSLLWTKIKATIYRDTRSPFSKSTSTTLWGRECATKYCGASGTRSWAERKCGLWSIKIHEHKIIITVTCCNYYWTVFALISRSYKPQQLGVIIMYACCIPVSTRQRLLKYIVVHAWSWHYWQGVIACIKVQFLYLWYCTCHCPLSGSQYLNYQLQGLFLVQVDRHGSFTMMMWCYNRNWNWKPT